MVDREATEPRSEDPRPEEPRSLEQSDGEQSTGADQHIVSLWASGIPGLGVIAEHNWFVINDCGVQTRWEVWQTANVICNDIGESWDHVHRDLLPPEQGMRDGPAYKLEEWRGETALYLIDRIRSTPEQYPWCSKYRYWPGPNSNTYVQWVLLGKHKLGRKALGKHYCRFERFA